MDDNGRGLTADSGDRLNEGRTADPSSLPETLTRLGSHNPGHRITVAQSTLGGYYTAACSCGSWALTAQINPLEAEMRRHFTTASQHKIPDDALKRAQALAEQREKSLRDMDRG